MFFLVQGFPFFGGLFCFFVVFFSPHSVLFTTADDTYAIARLSISDVAVFAWLASEVRGQAFQLCLVSLAFSHGLQAFAWCDVDGGRARSKTAEEGVLVEADDLHRTRHQDDGV